MAHLAGSNCCSVCICQLVDAHFYFGVVALLTCHQGSYSGVPNKRLARLLISEKFSPPTCFIWSYMFIRILKIVLPIWLFGPASFQNWTKQSKVLSICCSFSNNAPFAPKLTPFWPCTYLPQPSCLFCPLLLLDS